MPARTSLFPRVRRLMRREAARREAQDGAQASAAAILRPPAVVSATQELDDDRLATLEAEARHHRNRLALYRARVYANKPTSATHLRELERTAAAADERLAHARGRRSSERRAGP